jgi:N-acyl-D-amino-acid deacylase
MNHRYTRRQFLARAGVLGAVAGPWLGHPACASSSFAGDKLPMAEAFDREMEQFMSARKVPGGALAVVKDQRLVYARAYGWADRERKEPVKSESLFRIASISKPFTATAVLRLVETKGLDLETPVTELLPFKPVLANGKTADPRWRRVTLRHCLHHTGGWDRDASGDPMFRSLETARDVGVPPPASAEAIIRYMVGQPLDFEPGARYAYSNFGYCLLGRVIERLGGRSYEQFVREEVLAPMGIRRMRLGASLESGRAEGEVRYYTPDNREGSSVFPGLPPKVPEPYGTFCLEAMDSHGGWLASAPDLARFAATLDAPADSTCLKPDTRRILYEPPAPPVSRNPDGSLADHFYGCGWMVRPVGKEGRAGYSHNGSLPGTYTLLARGSDGLSWAALFNQRSESSRLPDSAIDSALRGAADAVDRWPH